MNNLSLDLPVKLEELCKFTFSFSNLIKVINFLHQKNLNIQSDLKDVIQRLYSLESLQNDIEDIKQKSINIQKSNENLTQNFFNLKENNSKLETNLSEANKKNEELEIKIKKIEKMQNSHDENINQLNQVVEENVKKENYLEDIANGNKDKIGKLESKIENNKNKCEELNKKMDDMNSKIDKNMENINGNIDMINNSIKNMSVNFEKNNSDINNKILNITNDVANITEKVNKNSINANKINFDEMIKINKELDKEIIPSEIPNFNINMDNNTSELVKAIMEEVESQKIKFNKLKEELKSNKENQNRQNETFKSNISKIFEDINSLKNEFDENVENMENNFKTLSVQKEHFKIQKAETSKIEPNNEKEYMTQINAYLSKYAPLDAFKKLSDSVKIITSALSSKISIEEVESKLKKINTRIESLEMPILGQTHGPKPRINLGLVNAVLNNKENLSNIPSEERHQIEEIDAWADLIQNKIGNNLKEIIHKEYIKLERTNNEKYDEIISNNSKNVKDIEKNYKSIIDIRNILINNPTKADLTKLKNELEKTNKECKINRIKIEELKKNIEGPPDDEENNQNNFPGTIFEKIKFLNQTSFSLSNKINSLENKHKSITKEVKEDIKQNLKIETAKIMQQFKNRLESFTTRFDHELKNKIDQIGLSDFETKMSNKFYIDLREKLDKNDLKKNNNLFNRKIDNLETKISKTLVDTIIDLQMDDQPLIIKKNGNGVDVCASCNQPVPKINSNGGKEHLNGSITNNNNTSTNIKVKGLNKSLNFTQPTNMKSTISIDKNLKVNSGQNKLPDIIPNIYQK